MSNSTLSQLKLVIAVLLAVFSTVGQWASIVSVTQAIINAIHPWIYPIMCVEPFSGFLLYLIFAGVFACVLLWHLTINVIMAL